MHRLPKRLRQILALALLVAAAAVLAGLTIVPVIARVGDLNEQIDTERVALGKFTAVAARQVNAAELEREGRLAGNSEAYLKGDSEALKSAALQALLSDLAGGTGVRVRSARTLPPRDRDELRLIGVRVQFNADIEQVRTLLHGIESAQPFLFIEAMQIQPLSAQSAREPDQTGSLDVRLDVFGAVSKKKG